MIELFKDSIEKTIHGQTMFVLPREKLIRLVGNVEMLDEVIKFKLVKDVILKEARFIVKENDLNLSLCFSNLFGRFWSYLILIIDGRYYRIHIEQIKCEFCDWEGVIANPYISDNYIGLNQEDRVKAKEAAMSLNLLNCPSCNSKLPRPAIKIFNELLISNVSE